MKLLIQPPKKSINKAFLKQRPLRSEMDLFKAELTKLLDGIDPTETEEFHKNLVSDFLKKAIYPDNFINTKGRQDLVIHNGKDNKTSVGVIIEAKRPSNKGDWFTADKPNGKALHELVLYYLRERIECNNIDIKYVIATNINEWYIFEAKYFERLFNDNKQLVKNYKEWRDGKKVTKDTSLFYNEIAKPYIDSLDDEIPCTYFNIQDYLKVLKNADKADDKNLIALLKVLSPQHLLKVSFTNDSNELDQNFYKELLHIIGLEEVKESGKNIIRRKKENKNTASLLEMAIRKLKTKGIHKIHDVKAFGETTDEQYFNIALELCITWINRILFLKLLEGQLITYHKGDKSYRFLNTGMIHDFDELFKLFHNVLAVNIKDRDEEVKEKYKLVPYLNSSLFEISELEDLTIAIDNLDNSEYFELVSTTILKEVKKKGGKPKTLEYLFSFLDAYDFASEGSEDIQEDNKPLINASVLGKVFERINGYKDGSIFTPAFITTYMCKETIRLAVIQKFNEVKSWGVKNLDELKEKIEYSNKQERRAANDIINSLKICDPAVGSGHFLVSALNELIAIKSELRILNYRDETRVDKDYKIDVENDELFITDVESEDFFQYSLTINGKLIDDLQKLQETLFHEKQFLIENCLFGVDINPNSVKICRLRLWIELLKNAYYKDEKDFKQLETLPNIDINIKCGNSLVSRFELKDDVFKDIPNFKRKLNDYKFWVNEYKNAKDRSLKRQLTENIRVFVNEFKKRDPQVVKLQKELDKKSNTYYERFVAQKLFAEKENVKVLKEKEKLESEIETLSNQINLLKANPVYKNAFEWRFEFPEVLNNDGKLVGFDVVIGNPPYVLSRETFNEALKNYFLKEYETIHEKPNLYLLFIEKSLTLLKQGGEFAFIIPNSLTGVESAYKVRELLISNYQIRAIINLLGETFDNVGVESCILMVSKQPALRKIKYQTIFSDNIEDISFIETDTNNWKNNRNYLFDISSSESESFIIEKIKLKSQPLSNGYDVRVGLQAYEKGKGKPKQTAEDVKNHVFDYDYKFDNYTYPYLNGGDIGRYKLNWTGQWLRYGEWLSQPKTLQQFSNARILIREITGSFPFVLQAMYVEETLLNNKSILNVLPLSKEYDLKFLLGFLNSKLISFYHIRQTVKGNRTLFPKIVIKDLQNYPLPIISKKQQEPIIVLVDKILAAKKMGKDTSDYERKIDELVYQLYDIMPDEREAIEGQANAQKHTHLQSLEA